MTSTLIYLLDSMTCLETLTVGKTDPSHQGSVVHQVQDLLNALRRNKTLKSFSVHSFLEDDQQTQKLERILRSGSNTTLQHVGDATFGDNLYSSWDDCQENGSPEKLGRIPYYLQWNKLGRCALRQSNASKAKLVEILATVTRSPPNYHQDLIFDVLLETPGLWTTS